MQHVQVQRHLRCKHNAAQKPRTWHVCTLWLWRLSTAMPPLCRQCDKHLITGDAFDEAIKEKLRAEFRQGRSAAH